MPGQGGQFAREVLIAEVDREGGGVGGEQVDRGGEVVAGADGAAVEAVGNLLGNDG